MLAMFQKTICGSDIFIIFLYIDININVENFLFFENVSKFIKFVNINFQKFLMIKFQIFLKKLWLFRLCFEIHTIWHYKFFEKKFFN